MACATDAQKAERLNGARDLLRQHLQLPEAAERLARQWSISRRQAYRYLGQAQELQHPLPIQDAKVSFTVKLSRRLVAKLRAYAKSTGLTLSEIVNRALLAVLHRGGGRG